MFYGTVKTIPSVRVKSRYENHYYRYYKKGFYVGMKVYTDVVGAGQMKVWKEK